MSIMIFRNRNTGLADYQIALNIVGVKSNLGKPSWGKGEIIGFCKVKVTTFLTNDFLSQMIVASHIVRCCQGLHTLHHTLTIPHSL